LKFAPSGRYVPLIQMQLMVDAYRRGDYAGARALAAKTESAPDAALFDFVNGLSAYQMGDFQTAHVSFAKVSGSGNPGYAPYAKYMDALTSIQKDTVRVTAAMDALGPMPSGNSPFADQVRLAAAQLAYRSGKFDAAAQYAAQVPATSGLAPDAQLARAWSLYRAGQFDSAAALFGDYATRWPQLPGRDEARLMHGQILLEQHHPAEADAYFTVVGDSLGAEIAVLQTKTNNAMAQAAKGLVAARASGALFVREAATGKSLMLAPDAGAEGAVMVAVFGGQMAPAMADSTPPVPVTQEDLRARFAALEPPLPADVPTRPFYANASGPAVYGDYVTRDQNLLAADLSTAVARYKLQVADADYARRLAALKNFQQLILEGTASLGEINKQIAFTRDSAAKMAVALATAREKIRTALTVQGIATSNAASKNLAQIDSVRASLGDAANSMDAEIMTTEQATAATYRRVADRVLKAADSAIGRHPAFATHDSIAAHLLTAQTLATEGQRLLLVNAALVQAELTRLNGAESDRTKAAKKDVTAAEQRRTAAEQQMVALLDGELRARVAQMVEALRRSREAADYGSASAAFFMAIDAKGGGGTAAPAPAPEQ
jgi:TolA-binding protein